MGDRNTGRLAWGALWRLAAGALVLPVILACGIFGGDPAPTPVPQLVSTNILTPTPTPNPTDTPAPTNTPSPTPTPLSTPTAVPTTTSELAATPIRDTDREALVAIYAATNGEFWARRQNWMSNAPIGTWHGVTTNANGRVTELILSENQLVGEIPSELGSLASLQELHLWGNGLRAEIPSELGSLTSLQVLALHQNRLSGEIPSELGNLAGLQELHLWGNELREEIPFELGSLINLQELALFENQLSGEIPSELGNLASLQVLARIHRKTTLGTVLEEARGCSSESGRMVLKQKTARKQGAPSRCCHRIIPTVSASSLTTTAWWPMPACSCRPPLHSTWACGNSSTITSTSAAHGAGEHGGQTADAGRFRAGGRRLHRRR